MINKILNPELTKTLKPVDEFLNNLGMRVTPSADYHESNASIQNTVDNIGYSFKLYCDHNKFEKFLSDLDITYTSTYYPNGRYPYKIIIKKETKSVSEYSNESISLAIDKIKELKSITVLAKDFSSNAKLREIEVELEGKLKMISETPVETNVNFTEDDQKHLIWIYERLIHVHNENPLTDYMRRFYKIIYKGQN